MRQGQRWLTLQHSQYICCRIWYGELSMSILTIEPSRLSSPPKRERFRSGGSSRVIWPLLPYLPIWRWLLIILVIEECKKALNVKWKSLVRPAGINVFAESAKIKSQECLSASCSSFRKIDRSQRTFDCLHKRSWSGIRPDERKLFEADDFINPAKLSIGPLQAAPARNFCGGPSLEKIPWRSEGIVCLFSAAICASGSCDISKTPVVAKSTRIGWYLAYTVIEHAI